MKRLSVLGCTGSIGVKTLSIAQRYPDKFEVSALTAGKNLKALAENCERFRPKLAGIADESLYLEAKSLIKGPKIVCGKEALIAAATLEGADTVVAAVVGMCGLPAVLAALRSGKDVALANKESLVTGGCLVMGEAQKHGVSVLPVDSEHSAVWQCLSSGKGSDLKRIILTASGGPFYGKTAKELNDVTPNLAAAHPNWKMGLKISIDSATMMNKGLEIIEAGYLFGTENIDYIVHRQSVIHSMVEFTDGAIIAQLGAADMEIPIQLALTYPERLPVAAPSYKFDRELTFSQPDEVNFPLPAVAKEALRCGRGMPVVLNAANEAAVELFLRRKIGFNDITRIVIAACTEYKGNAELSEQEIFDTHDEIYGKLMRDYNAVSEQS